MTLKELRILNELLADFSEFIETNCDSDEGTFRQEMEDLHESARKIISKECYKLHLRNALAKHKRKNKMQI